MDLKLPFYRLAFAVGMMLRVYSRWSGIHRLTCDQEAKDIILPTFRNVDEIAPIIRGFVWRPDSWIDLGDAVCTPQMVWYRHLYSVNHEVGDCDEFAIFLCNVIQKSIEDGVWNSNVEDPDMMSVTWLGETGVSGHNVCLLKLGTTFGYMDYDLPRWCGQSREDVVGAVLKRYAPHGDLIGWAVHSPELKLLEWHIR